MMKGATERSPRKAKGQGSERREEILAAALRLFTEYGVYAVSTRQIAQAVGISQPTLYAYFPTKDDIGRELHTRAFALLAEGLTRAGDRPMDTLEDCVRMLRVYVDFGLSNPDMYRIAFMAEGAGSRSWWRPEKSLSESTQSTYGVLRATLHDLHGRGVTVDIDPEILTQSVWSAMHGLVSLMISKPTFPWADREILIKSHLTLVARGFLKDV